jgi:hypothetical protein
MKSGGPFLAIYGNIHRLKRVWKIPGMRSVSKALQDRSKFGFDNHFKWLRTR